jgi:uncharacterized membrane protein YhaH (DUF805 family)
VKHKKFRAWLILLVISGIIVDFCTAYFSDSKDIFESNPIVLLFGWYGTMIIVCAIMACLIAICIKCFKDLDKSIESKSDEFMSFFIVCALLFIFIGSCTGIYYNITYERAYDDFKVHIEETIGTEFTNEEMNEILIEEGLAYETPKEKIKSYFNFRLKTILPFIFSLLSFIIYQNCYVFRRYENGKK